MDATPTPPPTTPSPTPAPSYINIDDFAKVQLRVGTVKSCTPHPNADKLLVMQVDLGDEQRQICAGLRGKVEPDAMVGKQIIVVANLAPRTMRGQVSQGMLLAASDASGTVIPLTVSAPIAAGSEVR